MRIVQLTGFTAKAEVLGFILPVQYDGSEKTLTIGGVETVQMASDLLDRMADKAVAVVGLPTDGAPVPTPAKASAKTENTKVAEAVQAAHTPTQAAPTAAVPAPAPQSAPPAPAAPVSAEPAAAPAGNLPADLNVNTTFRDLVIYLREKGIVEEAAVVVECEKLKPYLPALQRISDIADRVNRALSRK